MFEKINPISLLWLILFAALAAVLLFALAVLYRLWAGPALARYRETLRQRQITETRDALTVLFEDLWSDSISKRLAMLVVIQRIARNASDAHGLADMLIAFVRHRVSEIGARERTGNIFEDVRLALTVLASGPVRAAQRADGQSLDLSGLDFRGISFRGVDLSGVGLQNCRFEGCDLARAVLKGANLEGANLEAADLSNADLRKALMTDAKLAAADLSFAKLEEAVCAATDFRNADLNHAALTRTNLTEANLSDVDLSDSDLTFASLVWAKLPRANMRSSNLRGADCSSADMFGADLTGAIVRQASFDDTDLGSAMLLGAQGLNQRQLDMASCDANTAVPERFKVVVTQSRRERNNRGVTMKASDES